MKNFRPYCLSVAGYDPTGGAGVLADIKSFEMLGMYGMAVITANTTQTDREFIATQWIDKTLILSQMEVLMNQYAFSTMKIGLVQNFETLQQIVLLAKKLNPAIQMVWDPILKSSSDFDFHCQESLEMKFLEENCTLITPNWDEFTSLWGSDTDLLLQQGIKSAVLIKGGHRTDKPGSDLLYFNGAFDEIEGKPFQGKTKHGTGCVLSAAITAFLTKGLGLKASCTRAKDYVEQLILSNDTNLGYHYDNK